MRNLNLLTELARAANAYTKEPLPTIERLRRDSIATSPDNHSEARQSLILQRTSSVYYKDPSKQKRNAFRSKKDKAALASTDGWVYTKAERYAVLDQQIRNGGAPGLAQAILAFNLNDPLDVNVAYVADNNGDAISTGQPNEWLELAARRNERFDVLYIRLLSNFGASQASRDRALAIALQRGAMETVQELLRNDADPNALRNYEHFLAAIRDLNQQLYSMFLTATTPLNSVHIDRGLLEAVGRDADLVALLIAHGANGNDGQALRAAISTVNLQVTAMILVNFEGDFPTTILDEATSDACGITDEKTKLRFLRLLFSAGANADTSRIRRELLQAVKHDQISLVELFVECGTTPESNDAQSIRLAVSSGQVDHVRVLLRGSVSEASTSQALSDANSLDDLETFEEIVVLLVEKGVSKASLSKCLHDSIEKGATSVAPLLIEKGAILDYADAQSVRRALNRNDFTLFAQLLEAPCRPSILCGALQDAMKVQPPSLRFDVVSRLLMKGVSGKALHIALQSAARGAKDQVDYSLIEQLMKYNASIDFFEGNENCVCFAAAQQDEKVLDLLCQGNPSPDTVSAALNCLPVTFSTAEAVEYEQQVVMLSTLLEKGAYGIPVAEMLIKAVRDDHRQKALAALIQYGADANHRNGKAIEESFRLSGISALELICEGSKIAKNSFISQLPNVLRVQGFSLEKATLFAQTAKDCGYKDILSKPLLDEVQTNGRRTDVIKLLLGLGASVDFQNGQALQHAVSVGNVKVCRLLLGAGVSKSNIALAFPVTSRIKDRTTRYELMRALLDTAHCSVGQDEALVQASREAVLYDLLHVELLLEHEASANFDEGAAVVASIETKNLPLLRRLVQTNLDQRTLANAFATIRRTECKKEEKYDMFEAVLRVFSDEYQVSMALIEAVTLDAEDKRTACLLLDHGATLELKNGLAMQIVASKGSLELLDVFLSKGPSQSCRDAAFDTTTSSLLNFRQRERIYQALLMTGITQDLVSAALSEAARVTIIDHSVLTLLIDFNASLDYDDGSAVNGIVEKGDISSLTVLLTGNISYKETLDRSFSAAMLLSGSDRLAIARALLEKEPGVSHDTISEYLAQIVKEEDYDLLSLMMGYKPDPTYNGGESLKLCAQAGDAKSVRLLTRVGIPSPTVDQAFEQLLVARAIQMKPDGLETAKVLLEIGVMQHLIDRALLDGFDGAVTQLTSDLVEILIPYNPDVSGGDGKVFAVAASNGAVELFKIFAAQKPDLNIVIPALIRTLKDEKELISFLQCLDEYAQREDEPLHDFVIFTAITEFPQGRLLIEHLLAHGCPASSKTIDKLDNITEAETMNVLIWALSREGLDISDEVMLEILKESYDAKISFETSITCTTAALVAGKTGRNEVLERLIELAIDPNHRDVFGHSALFYASKMGHTRTADVLIEAGAMNDDGSLHEAARESHPDIVKLLLANGHRANYPSPIHSDGEFGRTALEELCLRATSQSGDWQKRIHQSISLLLPTRVKDVAQSGGKTMLHLALENENAIAVTATLLAFPFVWENINDPVYLFRDEQDYFYSPTKYVELLFGVGNPEKCKNLVTLLRASKCNDRLYAHTVIQPKGAVGLPDEVADAVYKQKRAEYEQLEDLRRIDAIAAHQRAIQDEDQERNLRSLKERHSLLLQQYMEQESTEKIMAQNKQSLALKHAQELQREGQDALMAENRIKARGEDEVGARRLASAKSVQQSEMAHRRNLLEREAAALQSKLSIERQILSATESHLKEEFKMRRELCDYQDASARYQALQRGLNK